MLPLRPFHPGDRVHEIDGTLQGAVVRTAPHQVVVECDDGLEHTFKPEELVHEVPWKVTGQPRAQDLGLRKAAGLAKKELRVQKLDLHLPESDNGHRALERQLSKLKNALAAAGWDQITVIHGVGEGILRNAVHELVRKETPYRIGSSSASETVVHRL